MQVKLELIENKALKTVWHLTIISTCKLKYIHKTPTVFEVLLVSSLHMSVGLLLH